MITASGLLRWQFRLVHDLLEGAVGRLPADSVRLRVRYAQVVLCEDLTISAGLGGTSPLALSSWAERTGMSELPPLAAHTDWEGWEGRVRVDLVAVRGYAQAVYGVTDTFLAGLSEEALDPSRGEGPICLLSGLLVTLAARRGELARG